MQGNAAAQACRRTTGAAAGLAIVDAVAVADVELASGAEAPKRMLDETGKAGREARVQVAQQRIHIAQRRSDIALLCQRRRSGNDILSDLRSCELRDACTFNRQLDTVVDCISCVLRIQ